MNNGSQIYRLYDNSLRNFAELITNQICPLTYYKGMIYWIRNISEGYYNWGMTDVQKKSSVITGCSLNFTATDVVFLDTVYIVGTKDGVSYMSKNCTADYKLSFG